LAKPSKAGSGKRSNPLQNAIAGMFCILHQCKDGDGGEHGAALSDFVNPSTGVVLGTETFTHAGG
jgi:hypothetical protein